MSGSDLLTPRVKWWEFELRFSRLLTRREQRRLSAAIDSVWSRCIGQDGVAQTTLDSKWPGEAEIQVLTAACVNLPDPRVRLAPLGAQHGAGCDCHPWDFHEGVRIGNVDACGVDVSRCPWWRLIDGKWLLDGA